MVRLVVPRSLSRRFEFVLQLCYSCVTVVLRAAGQGDVLAAERPCPLLGSVGLET